MIQAAGVVASAGSLHVKRAGASEINSVAMDAEHTPIPQPAPRCYAAPMPGVATQPDLFAAPEPRPAPAPDPLAALAEIHARLAAAPAPPWRTRSCKKPNACWR